MIVLFKALILFYAVQLYVIAINVPGRVLQGCALLDSQVYCYGGYQSASGGVFTNIQPEHLTFNVDQYSPTSNRTTPNWLVVNPPATPPKLEPRSAFSIASLDNNRYMILGGGHGNALNTPAIIYNRNTNNWRELSEPPFYMSEGAMISSDANTIFAYGGKLNSTSSYTPNNLLKLDLSVTPVKWTVLPTSPSSPPISRYGHAMIIRNDIIHFFGGFLNLPETNLQPNSVPLFNITWYNTLSDQWGFLLATGDKPEPRKYHTATLIGNSSKVLIYGGTGLANLQALPLLDYMYFYDLNSHTYTQVIPKDEDGGAGPRSGHSAILYENNIIISFGYDTSGNILNDTHALDVTNPSTPLWINQNNNNNTNPDGFDSGHDENPKSLSTGAIVGIVIGVLAIVTITGVLAFLVYRKRKNQEKGEFDCYIPPPQDFTASFPPTMFPENNDHHEERNNKNSGIQHYDAQSTQSTDPVPSYPSTKPHQGLSAPPTKPHEDIPVQPSAVKPSGTG